MPPFPLRVTGTTLRNRPPSHLGEQAPLCATGLPLPGEQALLCATGLPLSQQWCIPGYISPNSGVYPGISLLRLGIPRVGYTSGCVIPRVVYLRVWYTSGWCISLGVVYLRVVYIPRCTSQGVVYLPGCTSQGVVYLPGWVS